MLLALHVGGVGRDGVGAVLNQSVDATLEHPDHVDGLLDGVKGSCRANGLAVFEDYVGHVFSPRGFIPH